MVTTPAGISCGSTTLARPISVSICSRPGKSRKAGSSRRRSMRSTSRLDSVMGGKAFSISNSPFDGCSELVAERFPVTLTEFVRREMMILGAIVRDLDRAQQRRDAARGLPVEALHQTIQQTRSVGIAATGGITQFPRLHAGDFRHLAVVEDA